MERAKPMTAAEQQAILRLIQQGLTAREIMAASGRSACSIRRVARLSGLRIKGRLNAAGLPFDGLRRSDPTPQEIAERCDAIRSSWTPQERERRAVGLHAQAWEVPLMHRDEWPSLAE